VAGPALLLLMLLDAPPPELLLMPLLQLSLTALISIAL
jgi:hypothetical protein